MSYFNGAKLRQIRQLNRLSLSQVSDATGVSRSQICNIEIGKVDPRMSTVTKLLSYYNKGLADLEPSAPATVPLSEIREQGARNREALERAGFGQSDPWERLDRKDANGIDTTAEREVLAGV